MEKRKKIIGVDFDDTIFKHSYPEDDSEPNWAVINYLRQQKKDGAAIILVTCRNSATDVRFAVEACRRVGIEFDAVNDNLPEIKRAMGDCRKIFCHEYIDDKNITIDQLEEKRRPCKCDVYVTNDPIGLMASYDLNDEDIVLGYEVAAEGIEAICNAGVKIDTIFLRPFDWSVDGIEHWDETVNFLKDNDLMDVVVIAD